VLFDDLFDATMKISENKDCLLKMAVFSNQNVILLIGTKWVISEQKRYFVGDACWAVFA